MIPLAARRRAMLAADNVDTSTMRQAAILGGIVRCIASCGKINAPWVAQYTADILTEFKLPGVSTKPATFSELSAMIDKFNESYSQPFRGD